MAYMEFKKVPIVVLTGFQAAAYVNEHLRLNREDTFGECLDDALQWANDTGLVRPLADDQFEAWSIEHTGQIHAYKIDELVHPKTPFYYVVRATGDDAMQMFSSNFVAYRTYNLLYRKLQD